MLSHIRNFSIIAHIDHGKSTLADRLLELTGTIEKRKMQEQVLDRMELERERGITIKMQPVRMIYDEYILNLIDTPGHIDFSYEVSRALRAVEGVILVVDATSGVQAQTFTVLREAQALNLAVIPVINKIDLSVAHRDETKEEVAKLLNCPKDSVLEVSGKTGQGVPELLKAIIKKIPPPQEKYAGDGIFRALVFDFQYSDHKGVIVYVRVLDGKIVKGDELIFLGTGEIFQALEMGVFTPDPNSCAELGAGYIGYIVTGIKRAGEARVGDTVTKKSNPLPALSGYITPKSVVWASVYPENQNDFKALRQALWRLRLSDSSLSFEEETSGSLGRGFRCGFLGMLHMEIIMERLKREFSLILVVAAPTVSYEIIGNNEQSEMIYSPVRFPEHKSKEVREIKEPWVLLRIIAPPQYLGSIMNLLYEHEAEVGRTKDLSFLRMSLESAMPLRELMRDFFDKLKSISSGYASLSYEIMPDRRPAAVARLDISVNEEIVPAFTKIVSRRRIENEAREAVKKLKDILPPQLIAIKIQGKALGRVIAAERIAALKKDVTGYLYGGDITRKMKLRQKQKKGKKRMQKTGKINIPPEIFVKMIKEN